MRRIEVLYSEEEGEVITRSPDCNSALAPFPCPHGTLVGVVKRVCVKSKFIDERCGFHGASSMGRQKSAGITECRQVAEVVAKCGGCAFWFDSCSPRLSLISATENPSILPSSCGQRSRSINSARLLRHLGEPVPAPDTSNEDSLLLRLSTKRCHELCAATSLYSNRSETGDSAPGACPFSPAKPCSSLETLGLELDICVLRHQCYSFRQCPHSGHRPLRTHQCRRS